MASDTKYLHSLVGFAILIDWFLVSHNQGKVQEFLTWTSQNQKGTRLACIKHVKECMIKTENSSQCGFRSLRQHLSGISLFSRFDRLTLMRLRHILPFSPRRVV